MDFTERHSDHHLTLLPLKNREIEDILDEGRTYVRIKYSLIRPRGCFAVFRDIKEMLYVSIFRLTGIIVPIDFIG